jgi:hypothetical protein
VTRSLDNIKMNLGEIRWGVIDCIGLIQDSDMSRGLVNAEPSVSIKCQDIDCR